MQRVSSVATNREKRIAGRTNQISVHSSLGHSLSDSLLTDGALVRTIDSRSLSPWAGATHVLRLGLATGSVHV